MRARPLAVIGGLVLGTSLLLTGCGDSDSDRGGEASGVSCSYEKADNAAKKVDPPPSRATTTGELDAEISTSVGDLEIDLDADAAPCTVNSFVSLAKQGYFDDTSCHRLTTEMAGIFVLQCGDPSGSGRGGPGYSFADELSGSETYPAGTVAMANAGPNTNGSQFFLVYADTPLPASYTVFGELDRASTKLVADVAAKGSDDAYSPGSGHPNQPVDITTVTVD